VIIVGVVWTVTSLPNLLKNVTFAPSGFELIWTVSGPPSMIEAQPVKNNGAINKKEKSLPFISAIKSLDEINVKSIVLCVFCLVP
jgi:hypothetical protein